jgi:hypothetical protein
MTPYEWELWVQGWNEANSGNDVPPPTQEQFEALVAKYG